MSPPTGPEGLRMALEGTYDAAVIDVMLPGLDGLSLIEQLRAKRVQTPVLILSARHSVDDRVKGLHAGGDDHLHAVRLATSALARLRRARRCGDLAPGRR